MEENETTKTYGRIVFPGWKNNVIKNPDTIGWVEGYGNCIKVHLKCGETRCFTVCLAWLEDKLDPAKFFRIHDSHFVNGNWVTGYRPEGERYQVKLKKGDPLYVSRNRRDDFEVFIMPYIPDGYKRKKN
jgi:DNA-binding LytR/AlgR family response regulator